MNVYALLDEASDTTFVKTTITEKLGVRGIDTQLILSTTLGREEIPVSKEEGLIVQRIDRRVQVELQRTFTRDQIPSRRDQIPRPEIADKWPHLRRISDSILPYQEDLEIDLLIGCNCPKAIKPKEVILGKGDDPYALRSILGWGIIGPVGIPATDSRDKDGISTCNRILAREIGTGSSSNLSFVLQSQTKEKLIPVMVQRMFEQDFSERTVNLQGLSSEDRRFLSIAEEGIRHLENGHYELPLPIKKPDIQLPNNRELALRRLNQLKRRLMSDERYRQDYLAFMDKMFK